MKKAIAFLLALFIFVAPITTLVKADVVIGDNDEIVVNENAKILGRKMAIMESFSDLLLSGVTEFTISNTNSVDDYIDSLWTELNYAIDSLSDGTGFQEISNNLKSKYIYNLMNYRDYITNRGDYLSYTLQNPTTSLLQTFFADNIYGKIETTHYDLASDMFRALSNLNNDNNTDLPDIFNFLNNINHTYIYGGDIVDLNSVTQFYNDRVNPVSTQYLPINCSLYSQEILYHVPNLTPQSSYSYVTGLNPIININIISNQDNTYTVDYGNYNIINMVGGIGNNIKMWGFQNYVITANNGSFGVLNLRNSFDDLSNCVNYIYTHFGNINLFYNNVPWVIYDNSYVVTPSLDIDGYLKIYGNNNPVQYELQPNTKIDYDQLYQVIYNAIRDNLPISQGDINYYDSHDTIYSPTIINNYGDEEGEESDLIDTILDYAVIPKFDTAIAQPMRAALTNGVVIMNTSITDVIPNEILLILGACFFLLLFAVVINRMIK